jgi:hypothetical protein
MSQPRRTRLYLSLALLAVLPISALVWAAVEHVRDAADRAH